MGLENNSSFESIPNQIHKQSEEEAKKTVDNAELSKKLPKINDILDFFEGKIDKNLDNDIRKILNESDFDKLDTFLKDPNSLSQINNLNSPDEIRAFFQENFNNKTKGGIKNK
ncbi:MAG: hypothetical protein PHS49_07750 [Candidatus Gracilibacteria bacterium]|nr:hypothetical protein [Candidatus Gracilibacteria bacterium]